jgi:HTH-type transcriptional regulator/antitoxin HigA
MAVGNKCPFFQACSALLTTGRTPMRSPIKPIRTEADHRLALKEIERLWGAKPGTPDGDRLEVLAILVERYEKDQFPIDAPTAIAAIEFRIEQLGLDESALKPMIGSSAHVREVMTGKRQLTLAMIRRLREQLDIPVDILIRPQR